MSSTRSPFPAIVLIPLMAGFVSCRALLPRMETDLAQALPGSYGTEYDDGLTTTNAWWAAFANAEIDRLMQQAIGGNLSMAQSAARLRQACALARRTGSARLPEASVSAGAANEWQKSDSSTESGTTRTERYSLGLAASYELDLWGRVYAVTESTRMDADASRLDLETAVMTVAAQVVDTWLQLVEARLQTELLRGQIDTNTRVLSLLKKRVGKSSTSVLDVYQQEQSVLSLQSALPLANQKTALLGNALAVLLGLPAGSDLAVRTTTLPALPPRPEAGIPADLLIQRPDVHAEYLRVMGAGWDVAAARADRLPALRLTARGSTEADDFGALFDNWLANLAAGLTAPLLDGGRRRSEVARVKAALDEALLRYRQVVLQAAREVEDALIRESSLQEHVEAMGRELDSAKRVFDEAGRRYMAGASDYVPVLLALRGLQQSERDFLAVRREQLSSRVGLYRALGGAWTTDIADAVEAKKSILAREEISVDPGSDGMEKLREGDK